ncbi:Mitogen-activated protein kinase kinase 5 [Phytophthora boehmeriae]|uniref:Mitogen-activated protein kinase kinase 5 n=1 Tax=Phytophthora boehmeriae TaxID=109152 RepID=A0A8T1VQG9_9STRA|nr:Mitogen-activated protein kinase kinase 5 [Phytophthora boehmeriae]
MMVVLQEEAIKDYGSRRKSVIFADESTTGEKVMSEESADRIRSRPEIAIPRRSSSITLSMNSPEAADFKVVAHDGPEQLGMHTKRVKKLGKGAGGTVFLSLYLPTLRLVAVKEVVVYQEEDRHMVKRELHALHENLAPIDMDTSDTTTTTNPKAPNHRFFPGIQTHSARCPYLVTFYGAFLKPARSVISVVMEFMDLGSVQDLIDANITVPESVLRHAAFCCVTALHHMHRQRMIHRDIKPANILINRKGEFKIADFGLAGTLAKSNSFFSEFTGTMMYMAPERISGAQYTRGTRIDDQVCGPLPLLHAVVRDPAQFS